MSGVIPLHEAVKKNDLEEAKQLLEKAHNVNVLNESGANALFFCTSPEMCELLLDFEVEFYLQDNEGYYPIHMYAGKPDVVVRFFELGYSVLVERHRKKVFDYGTEEEAEALRGALEKAGWSMQGEMNREASDNYLESLRQHHFG